MQASLKQIVNITIVFGIAAFIGSVFFKLTFTDLILLLTAIILFFYTRATQQANELQTRPALTLSFKETTNPGGGSRNGEIKLKNIGKGPAYDVHFHRIILEEKPRGSFIYTFYLDNRVLEVDEERELKMWIKPPDGLVEGSDMMRFLSRLIPGNLNPELHKQIQAKTPALFVVNYKGLNGHSYHSIYRLYSIVPPVGAIVMQLLHHGEGKQGILWARLYYLIKPMIPHDINIKPVKQVKQSRLVNLLALIHKYLK